MAFWKKCSNCKSELKFGEPYQVCSVSTCNHPRSGLQFCSTSCWSAHLPIYRHKEAWAIEKIAPSEAEWARENSGGIPTSQASAPQRRIIPAAVTGTGATGARASGTARAPIPARADEKEILVVVSKLKAYIALTSEMNTSADVMEKLSDLLRRACDNAVKNARASGRKTVMARDFLD